jgi:hypothetical protein
MNITSSELGLWSLSSFVAKTIIHRIIDSKHGRDSLKVSTFILPWAYFLPYLHRVKPEYQVLRAICNFLYVSFLFSIIATLYLNPKNK